MIEMPHDQELSAEFTELKETLEKITRWETFLDFLKERGFQIFLCINSVHSLGKHDSLFISQFNRADHLRKEGHHLAGVQNLSQCLPSLTPKILENGKRCFMKITERNLSEGRIDLNWDQNEFDILKGTLQDASDRKIQENRFSIFASLRSLFKRKEL